MKRIRKKILPGRFPPATLRRVWARELFEPIDGFLHNTDKGYLKYDLWEHVDIPPEGLEHGLRTRKVKAFTRTANDSLILARDGHAWVGLPTKWETVQEKKERLIKEKAQHADAVRWAMSPYQPQSEPVKAEQAKAEPVPVIGTEGVLGEAAVSRSLERFGYSEAPAAASRAGASAARAKGTGTAAAPKIGDKMYDPSTGNLLTYRRALDGLHWRTSDMKRVHLKGPLDDIPLLPLDPPHVSLGYELSYPSIRQLKSGFIEVRGEDDERSVGSKSSIGGKSAGMSMISRDWDHAQSMHLLEGAEVRQLLIHVLCVLWGGRDPG